MSKKKNRYFRKIIVNNKKYTWKVSHFNCDGDGSSKFKIWDNDKNLILEELVNPYNQVITPKIVSDKIKIINKKKWN